MKTILARMLLGAMLAYLAFACAAGLANRRDAAVHLTISNASQFDAFRVKVCAYDGTNCRTIGRVYSLGVSGPFSFRPNYAGNSIALDFIGGGTWFFPLTAFEGEQWVLNVSSQQASSYFSRPSVANVP